MTNADRLEIDQTGHCDCGAVQLSAKGRVVSMFQCACDNCQRAGGSGHSSVVLLQSDAISVIGDTKSYARPADSGATFTRHFCLQCGTTVHGVSSRAPAIKVVPVGIFAGANDWFAPNQLIFDRSHRDWDAIEARLPHHQTYREASPK